MPDRERIMADLKTMMDNGCGLVCVHYATGLAARHVTPEGDHELLRWMGGYFATNCPHHQSIAKIYPAATIEPTKAEHPVLRGWKPFTVHDEPYINNYFGKDGPAKNVTPLATSMLPPDSPKPEIVAWAVSRDDGGRGIGVVMPHFYRNWQVADLRKLILNGIVWSARLEVPAVGVETQTPDLAQFEPAAIEPRPATK
jgi:type 1 glutamine amidotransferase